jgi:hypothetical protein
MEARLQQIPGKREMPWRPGVDPSREIETGGQPREGKFGLLTFFATRGEVQNPPCQYCSTGKGKFKVCVALPDYFKEACASCQLGGRTSRCSVSNIDGRRHDEACTVRDRPFGKSSINTNFYITDSKRRMSCLLEIIHPTPTARKACSGYARQIPKSQVSYLRQGLR